MSGESLSSYVLHRWFWALFWFFALHNIEEAVASWLMPDLHGRVAEQLGSQWATVMPAQETFYIALAVVTAILFVYVLIGTTGHPSRFQLYMLSIFAWLMLINVLIPHLPAAIMLKSYVPGLATAVIINVPLSIVVIRKLWSEAALSNGAIFASLVISVIALVGLLPLIHALSGTLTTYLQVAT